MPTRLTLLRHAKSSWNDRFQNDFERPLNKRGMRDAPRMGQLLREQQFSPQLILSSTAERAKATALCIAREVEYPDTNIKFEKSLYLATAEKIFQMVADSGIGFDEILIVGHNPGITEAANLVGNARVDNMPTCSVISFLVEMNDWKELPDETGKLDWFLAPKINLPQTDPG